MQIENKEKCYQQTSLKCYGKDASSCKVADTSADGTWQWRKNFIFIWMVMCFFPTQVKEGKWEAYAWESLCLASITTASYNLWPCLPFVFIFIPGLNSSNNICLIPQQNQCDMANTVRIPSSHSVCLCLGGAFPIVFLPLVSCPHKSNLRSYCYYYC